MTLETARAAGAQACLAKPGRQAIAALTERQFDLVLMDCHMPNMDGFEATRHWRQLERSRGTRVAVVALTANAMASDRLECLAAGMDGHLAKPVKLADLRLACERWAASSRPAPRVA